MIFRSAYWAALLLVLHSGDGTAQERTETARIQAVEILGNTKLSSTDLTGLVKFFLGREASPLNLAALRNDILERYRHAGYKLVAVSQAERTKEPSYYLYRVTEIEVGTVKIVGNDYFSSSTIRSALSELKENDSPNLIRLSRQLFLANDNPKLELAINFNPPKNKQANIDIKVRDSNPVNWFVKFDNTGDENTGRTRISVTGVHTNLFKRGHLLAGTFATSPEKSGSVQQYGVLYQLPVVSFGDKLRVYGGYSDIRYGVVSKVLDVSGSGTSFGAHYLHTLFRSSLIHHELDIGIDYRAYTSTQNFSGSNIGTDVTAKPLSFAYQYKRSHKLHSILVRPEYLVNLSGGSNNTDAAYTGNRFNADKSWDTFKFSMLYTYQHSRLWFYSLDFKAQFSDEPLIAGEQFRIGGVRSIRGYEESEMIGDSGYSIRAQAERTVNTNHKLIVFVDHGEVQRENPVAGEKRSDAAASIGVGWRWLYKKKFRLSTDVAHTIRRGAITDAGLTNVHFSMAYLF